MKIQAIKIRDQNLRWRRVWALVEGNIAIHPSYNGNFVKGRYSVSHLPTGLLFGEGCDNLDKNELPRIVKEIKAVNFGGVRAVDMPTCELVNVSTSLKCGDGSRLYRSEQEIDLFNERMKVYQEKGVIDCGGKHEQTR